MGQFLSSSSNDKVTEVSSTPDLKKTPNSAYVDPRSPITDYNRTPILVEGTKVNDSESPLTTQNSKSRSLHQRIMDKKMASTQD